MDLDYSPSLMVLVTRDSLKMIGFKAREAIVIKKRFSSRGYGFKENLLRKFELKQIAPLKKYCLLEYILSIWIL